MRAAPAAPHSWWPAPAGALDAPTVLPSVLPAVLPCCSRAAPLGGPVCPAVLPGRRHRGPQPHRLRPQPVLPRAAGCAGVSFGEVAFGPSALQRYCKFSAAPDGVASCAGLAHRIACALFRYDCHGGLLPPCRSLSTGPAPRSGRCLCRWQTTAAIVPCSTSPATLTPVRRRSHLRRRSSRKWEGLCSGLPARQLQAMLAPPTRMPRLAPARASLHPLPCLPIAPPFFQHASSISWPAARRW